MALPKQVQAQLEVVEQYEKQALEQAAPKDGNPVSEPAAPQPQPPEPVQQAEPPAAPPAEDAAYWRQRFEVIQGKYSAEVPKMAQALRERDTQLQSLKADVESLKAKPPEQIKVEPLVTTNDEEKFGSDLIDAMRRVARDEGRTMAERITAHEKYLQAISPQMQRVEQVEKQVIDERQGRFMADVAAAVPDWQEINVDQRWLAWLNEVEPLAGCRRQELLDAAANAMDAKRTAMFFQQFKATLPAAPTPRSQAKAELNRQVAPPKSSTTTVQPQGEKAYTGDEYAYWSDPRRVNDTPKEQREAMAAELERALVEGRIRW